MPYDPDFDGDEDYIEDGYISEDEELGYDTHVPFVEHAFPDSGDTHTPRFEPEPALGPTPLSIDIPNTQHQRLNVRVRPMSARLQERFPHARSIFLVMDDGRVIVLTKKD